METSGTRKAKPAGRTASSLPWSALAVLSLAAAAGGISARLEEGPRYDWLLLAVAIFTTGAVAMRLLADNAAEREGATRYAGDPLKDLLDSAGPIIVSMDLDGRLTYVNTSAERLLGYHAAELVNNSRISELLAPGEGTRLLSELQRSSGNDKVPEEGSSARSAAFAEVVRSLPPSQVPNIETHLRRKDGTLFPVRLQLSALRNQDGEPIGLVAVALDQSTTSRKDQWKREARERYRDVFENSSEMIATLDLAGRFLYVNPAWRRCFGQDQAAGVEQQFFEEAFGPDGRAEAAALLRRVLDGETIDRAPMRNETAEGHLQELELSLHQRRRAGKPMAVQCLVRDVTQQKQREHRLALQLLVTQIVGENVSSEMAAMRVLEALCVSQGWDVAVKWEVNTEENRLEFSTAWGVPGQGSGSADSGEHGDDAGAGRQPAGQGVGGWPPGVDHGPGQSLRGHADQRRLKAQDGFRLGGASAGGKQRAGGSGVLLPSEAARRSRDDGSHGDGGRLAGPDAGQNARARARRGTEPPAEDSAALGGRRHLRR